MEFSLNSKGDISKYIQNLNGRVKEVKKEFLKEVHKNLQIYTPVRTGTLLNGMKLDEVNFTITNDVDYAAYVEFGTSRFAGRYMMTKSYNDALNKLSIIVKNVESCIIALAGVVPFCELVV